MKKMLLSSLLLLTTPAMAGDVCNLHMDAGLRVSANALEFYDRDKVIYQIKDQRHLVVDGQTLELSDAQQGLISQYDQHVRSLVPHVKSLALEAIDLATEGVTLMLGNLVGETSELSLQLRSELDHFKGDLRRHFEGDVIDINHDQHFATDLGAHFETRVTRVMETAVQNSLGEIMLAVAKEVFLSGGDKGTFEERMNRLEKEMETHMQTKAAQMDARGRNLCEMVHAVNQLEDEMRAQIPAIRHLDVIQLEQDGLNSAQKI